MMQVIECAICGKSNIKLDKTFVTVTYTKYVTCCESCGKVREVIRDIFYCSEDCYHDSLRSDMERGDF